MDDQIFVKPDYLQGREDHLQEGRMHLVNQCITEVCPNSDFLSDKSDPNQTALAKGPARNM